MNDHPFEALSLLPPIIAIVLAILTRRAVLSLLLGIFVGALVTNRWQAVHAAYDFFEVHLWPTLTDPGKLRVFAFTLLMGAMVGVISRSGGMHGLIEKISPFARTRRGGQLTTWLLGWVIFFDDYANTILLGSTLRPLADRLRISREKLAYLVDSTAAPIAGLALLSTWVAVEIDYIGDGLEQVDGGAGVNAMSLFVDSIPYRFYVLGALLFVPIVALMGREFGPMLRAEQMSAQGQRSAGTLDDDVAEGDKIDPDKARWYNAAIPIGVTLAIVMWLLYTTGKQSLGADLAAGDLGLRDILGAADSSLSLQYGALAGLVTAGLLCMTQRILDFPGVITAAGKGARVVLPALAILWCASALSRLTGNKSVDGQQSAEAFDFDDHRLYTGDYLAALIMPTDVEDPQESVTIKLLPTMIFVLAGVLAFSTGTSFGTMGILMPMVIGFIGPVVSSTGEFDAAHPILLAAVASVLAGAVFGDHCSPISDTTILSSQACACDHMAHVVTQMPYAVSVGTVAIVFGTLPVGWGVSVWILLPVQVAVLIAMLRVLGTRVE
ncbi:Na+/H+ antiporter NhaC family protein [Planctomycetes bacterium K23_9]|uniref:Malate-2H(+)/Na(+)-lactate antiporter n=1 Tax=Stieleria marina TaxID=1930275 RepID=A0A517P3A4_9BACT|nr:Malate-2H(+)/Na(+)-lactate antiporter [Planctomycetes bacterium K23_9]